MEYLQQFKHVSTINIVIDGDNQIVIQALKESIQIPWQISKIIKVVHAWSSQSIHIITNHIFREVNMTTNWLSKFGHSQDHSLQIYIFHHFLYRH